MVQTHTELQDVSKLGTGSVERTGILSRLREHWGLQAWMDMWILDSVLVKHGQPLVSYTLLPIIRLASADADEVDERFADFRRGNERVRWHDSPRTRWRKRYGRFVREIEWAFLEMQGHFPDGEYERIVVDSASAIMYETIGGVLEFANSALNPGERDRPATDSSSRPPNHALRARMNKALVRIVDPSRFAHFLTGDGEVTHADLAAREIEVEIPDCAWHRVASSEFLPVPGNLPEQGCLVMCKATCEKVFDGRDGLQIEFEPHLPETSCTMRIRF